MAFTGFYSVKFMFGSCEGVWLRNQTFRQVIRHRTVLAELLQMKPEELYRTSFLKNSAGTPWAYSYKGEFRHSITGERMFAGVMYVVSEFEDE